MPRNLETDIAALLEEAETARGVYEADSLSGDNPAWAAWYAAYLLEMGLGNLLPSTATGDPDTLEQRLEALHAALQHDDLHGNWVQFFAERLAARERDTQARGHH